MKTITTDTGLVRCDWCLKDDLYKHYRDTV